MILLLTGQREVVIYDSPLILEKKDFWVMKVLSSLKSAKTRGKGSRVISRRSKNGKRRVYVINKQNPRLKARQG